MPDTWEDSEEILTSYELWVYSLRGPSARSSSNKGQATISSSLSLETEELDFGFANVDIADILDFGFSSFTLKEWDYFKKCYSLMLIHLAISVFSSMILTSSSAKSL